MILLLITRKYLLLFPNSVSLVTHSTLYRLAWVVAPCNAGVTNKVVFSVIVIPAPLVLGSTRRTIFWGPILVWTTSSAIFIALTLIIGVKSVAGLKILVNTGSVLRRAFLTHTQQQQHPSCNVLTYAGLAFWKTRAYKLSLHDRAFARSQQLASCCYTNTAFKTPHQINPVRETLTVVLGKFPRHTFIANTALEKHFIQQVSLFFPIHREVKPITCRVAYKEHKKAAKKAVRAAKKGNETVKCATQAASSELFPERRSQAFTVTPSFVTSGNTLNRFQFEYVITSFITNYS